MGKNARKYFENEFESEKQINKLIGLLEIDNKTDFF